jgi:hypothetical protein
MKIKKLTTACDHFFAYYSLNEIADPTEWEVKARYPPA